MPPTTDSTFLTRVEIRNFKSIAHCDVRLSPLNFLVGPNGSGKSNFVDALRFVRDCMVDNFDQALSRQRGTSRSIVRAGSDLMAFRLEFVSAAVEGFYELELSFPAGRGPVLRSERCHTREFYFDIHGGVLTGSTIPLLAAAPKDRLFLTAVSGLAPFEPVYRALESMKFYAPDPIIAPLASPGSDDVLDSDGENLARIFDKLGDMEREHVEESLRILVPGLESLSVRDVEGAKILLFQEDGTQFFTTSMSDGTMRALTLLVAMFQPAVREGRVPLMCFEEPETGIHPGALGVILDACTEASLTTQLIVTSHSPDLLDDKDIPAESILAVVKDGDTKIGPIAQGLRDGIRRRLFTGGNLLGSTDLEPEPVPMT